MAEKCEKDCKEVNELNKAVFGENRDGLAYEMEHKIDKKCLGQYVKKPHISIVVAVLVFLFSNLGASIYSGYNIFYAFKAIPILQAAETKTNERMYKIEKSHEVLVNIVNTIANTQEKMADALEKQGKQMIELTNDLRHEKEQSRKINEELIELLKQRRSNNHNGHNQ